MNIDNELIRAMQDCDTTKARVSSLYKKSEDLRGFRSWDLHTRDPSVKAAAESIAATKREIAAKEKGTRCIRGIGDRYPLWFPYVRSNTSETTLRRSSSLRILRHAGSQRKKFRITTAMYTSFAAAMSGSPIAAQKFLLFD
jgi:hypothetical protein